MRFALLLLLPLGCSQPAASELPKTASPNLPIGCQEGDRWTVELRSVAAAGKGCQEGGKQAQAASTHIFEVIAQGAALSVRQLKPSTASAARLEVNLAPKLNGNLCQLTGRSKMAIAMPVSEQRPGEARFTYAYDVAANGKGSGEISYSFVETATARIVRPLCSEPLAMNAKAERL
jgi:hypothetical protein